ncbi:MAG: hypothetical protein AAGF58_13465 [Pseudomonadota bacterium]
MLEALKDPWMLHWATSLLILWPAIRIFRRAGFPSYYAAIVFVPLLSFTLFFAILAVRPWPRFKQSP